MSKVLLLPWVLPFRGVRETDAWGDGTYGARRTKGGRVYAHPGLDLISVTKDTVPAPLPGFIRRLGIAYLDDPATRPNEADLRSIHIEGDGGWAGMFVKLFYAKPLVDLKIGDRVGAGEQIAVAQDRAGYATAKDPTRGPMTNHVHGELYLRSEDGRSWNLANPADFLDFPGTD